MFVVRCYIHIPRASNPFLSIVFLYIYSATNETILYDQIKVKLNKSQMYLIVGESKAYNFLLRFPHNDLCGVEGWLMLNGCLISIILVVIWRAT